MRKIMWSSRSTAQLKTARHKNCVFYHVNHATASLCKSDEILLLSKYLIYFHA